jgi:hypothetical protein
VESTISLSNDSSVVFKIFLCSGGKEESKFRFSGVKKGAGN